MDAQDRNSEVLDNPVIKRVGDDVGGYVVVVNLKPKDVWYQEDGKPGFVEWRVYEVQGLSDGKPVFWKQGTTTNFPGTSELANAEWEAEGSVKWDGCTNWSAGSTHLLAHTCDLMDLKWFLAAIELGTTLSYEAVGYDFLADD